MDAFWDDSRILLRPQILLAIRVAPGVVLSALKADCLAGYLVGRIWLVSERTLMGFLATGAKAPKLTRFGIELGIMSPSYECFPSPVSSTAPVTNPGL